MAETMHSASVAGGVVKLRGPSALRLKLQGMGAVQLAWEPEDRRQAEVEIRARLVSCDGVIGTRPILRMRAELGHGKSVWSEPPTPFTVVAGSPIVRYVVPARGGLWRLNVRELRLIFQNGGAIGGPLWTEGEVDVSIQPCSGMQPPHFPRSHLAFPVAGVVQPFPIEATEWRACDERGLPLALGAVAVLFAGSAGALFGISDASLFADWNPIPKDAVGWGASAAHWAAFR